jgi:hypothetical protein
VVEHFPVLIYVFLAAAAWAGGERGLVNRKRRRRNICAINPATSRPTTAGQSRKFYVEIKENSSNVCHGNLFITQKRVKVGGGRRKRKLKRSLEGRERGRTEVNLKKN